MRLHQTWALGESGTIIMGHKSFKKLNKDLAG